MSNSSEATFARDLGLFDATMIGVGAMIGAGIFVLTGIAAGESGPASLLAFALNGAVTLLTAFAYAELASAIPRAGGGYSFVRMAFPGALGFTSGWMLWFAYTVACSLYALGFAGYFWEFFLKYFPGPTQGLFGIAGEHIPILVVTLLVGLAFIRLNIRGAEVTGKAENALTLAKMAVLGIFIVYGLRRVFAAPDVAADNFTPFFPLGGGGVLVAMGLTFIAFEGYDLIATVAEEIKEPERNIPRATFIALAITVTMYLLILFVSLGAVDAGGRPTWEFLGEYKETAIVRAAEDFMPTFGVVIIVFGGLLSTMSALNATVLASSRVAFSMARDNWLPREMSKIHPERRTPRAAIIVTGVILLGMALTLPIETVGSAASLIFLLTFALVNLAVIALRRKMPELPRVYRVPLYPLTPILGIALNVFLALYQFKFQPMAWYVTAGWVIFGLLIYFAHFEKIAAVAEPQVLVPSQRPFEAPPDYAVIVPLHNPDNVEVLLDFARPIAEARGRRLVAISVVEVPRQLPIHEGMRFTHHREPLVRQAREYADERGIELETDLVIAHHAHHGILEAADRHQAEVLLMGWKGFTDTRERIFGEVADQVIRFAPCDLMLLKLVGNAQFRRCLFPTAGGPHAQLAAEFLNALAREFDMEVTTGYVVPPDATPRQRAEAERWMEKTLTHVDPKLVVEKRLIEARSVPGGLALASRDFDLVVIGAAKEPLFHKVLLGEIPEKVARHSPTSVLVVKRYEGTVKSLVKRLMG
ncbi:MAG: amino acid permease [Gemmatimonadetes bacterium]|uniref:Amino acid permease n=1 Tax=Candidatus Kutchimonas denitrificans TaxID=3056748 RepID=A0AAE4ZCG7_9BACT|nr:amino acid permease [Gemmatimonadota bacterium]NIR75956.1 amino acid permease [Candidatus Kutchimonas denitrificans]NIS02113.1 amino acid permease [Gemmatimonadota bacterium]NIT67938.1 amino acid permease [Gemmatimonadota bacterium]NIU53932.1 amino acid permease [Gemmatimonadota bacterium]